MTVRTKIKAIGNSQGIVIPKELMASAGLSPRDEVIIEASGGKLIITRSDSDYAQAMQAGRRFARHYRRTMAALAE